ncbi:transportin-1 isoform X1 [Tanacetum coccineum]
MPRLIPVLLSNMPYSEDDEKLLDAILSYRSTSDDASWKEKEASVLDLGAIAEGCINGEFWINNKRVQEAACSAFATLKEESADELAPCLEIILQHLMCAFGKYQRRNLRIIYDAIGTLAYVIGRKYLLLKCCMDDGANIRQSAFTLLGDLARVCLIHLRPRLPDFLDVAAKQLNTPKLKETISVANNACWAIGELEIKVNQAILRLVPILQHAEGLNKSLIENSAITLDRLALVCPELVSPHMEHFMQSWCIDFTYNLDMLIRERYPKFIYDMFLLPYLLSRGKVFSQS